MERRVTSHTEEEEMNQRRHLLTLARKGDQESIDLLFEFYQVKVFTGDALNKKKLPSFPVAKPANSSEKGKAKPTKVKEKTPAKVREKTPKVSQSVSKAKVKPKKEKTEKTQSTPKRTSKVQSKAATVKSQPQKVKAKKASLKKTPTAKKIVPPKKNKLGGKSKGKALGSAKKTKITKKK